MEYKYLFASLTPAIGYFFSFVFLRLWLKHREEWHILGFGVSFFIAGSAIMHVGLLAPAYTLTHALIFHFSCSCGMMILNWSISKRSRQAPPFTLMFGWTLVTTLAVIAATLATDDAFYRIFAVEAAAAGQFAIGMWASKRAENGGSRVFGGTPTYAIPMVLLATSPLVIYAYEGAIDPTRYSESLHWSAMMWLAPITIVILSTNILLALSDDLAERIKRAHQTDFLTGLPNRQSFEEQAEKLFAESVGAPISMVLADIDNFKRVNDTHGHHTGDLVLTAFGELLRKTVDAPHLVGRVGGEEFCIVLWQTNERAAKLLATQLCVQFASLAVPGTPDGFRFTASFGVAERGDHGTQETVYRDADSALYAAKAVGKNRVAAFTNLASEVGERTQRLA